MNYQKIIISLIVIIFSVFNITAQNDSTQQIVVTALFEYPIVPDDIEDWTERNNWLIENFWGQLDFDQKSVGQIQLNHAFKTWVVPMRFANKDVVLKATDKLLSKLSKNPALLYQFTKAAEDNLYSPTAEVWIDEVYVKFLKSISVNKKIDDIRKIRYKIQYEKLNNSLLGNTAKTFGFVERNGQNKKIDFGDKYVIIEFGHPDCTDCRIATIHLETDTQIGELIADGKLQVYYIIPDMDNDEWQRDVSDYPQSWIVGASDEVEDMYDIRLSPTFYVISPDKKILVKNAPIEEILQAIKELVK